VTPLRLLVLAILCYLGWRMLRGWFGQKRSDACPKDDISPEDVLVEDPFCHVLIPKRQALQMRKDGVTYYFCSQQCCDQFAEEPEKGET
jgi:YHS domain-containing protein